MKKSKGRTKEKITPSSKRSSIANIVVSEHAAPCRPGTHTLLCWIFLAHNGGFWLTHSCVGWDLHFTVDLIWEQSPNHRSKSNFIIEILPVCLGYCLLYPTRKRAHMIPCMWKWIWNFFSSDNQMLGYLRSHSIWCAEKAEGNTSLGKSQLPEQKNHKKCWRTKHFSNLFDFLLFLIPGSSPCITNQSHQE